MVPVTCERPGERSRWLPPSKVSHSRFAAPTATGHRPATRTATSTGPRAPAPRVRPPTGGTTTLSCVGPYTDVVEGQRAMRAELPGVEFVMMLHSIATGNILPTSAPLVCVDINPATVTKLADRGSA